MISTIHQVSDLLRWSWYRLRSIPLMRRWPQSLEVERFAFASVVNDDFMPYMEVLLHSVKVHHPDMRWPWIIFWNPIYSPLTEGNRNQLQRIYPHIEFREVDASRYESFMTKTPEKWLAALFTLEIFGLREFERVCFIDADILCCGDISQLWQTPVAFGACRSGCNYREKMRYADIYTWDGGFNSGVMIVGGQYLNAATYEALFEVPYKDFGDQEILNKFFQGKPVYLLPHKYNYHAEFFWDEYGDQDDVRILHYAGAKPLDQPDLPRMKPWFDCRASLNTQ